jgi:hypothetical protein
VASGGQNVDSELLAHLEEDDDQGLGWAAVGLRQMRKGGKRNWVADPIRLKTFFCKNLFSFVFSKPSTNLVVVLKLFENSNLLKIFKCLCNL